MGPTTACNDALHRIALTYDLTKRIAPLRYPLSRTAGLSINVGNSSKFLPVQGDSM